MSPPQDSDLEFLRAREALRRGWLRRDQVSDLLREAPAGLLDEGVRRGWLDPSQARRLREASFAPPGAPDEDPDPLGPGSVLAGRYRVESVHQGGFGRVYVCRTAEGERAALKTLRRIHLDTPGLREDFVREARRWIALGRHPHLVAALGIEEHLRLPFLVMECVEGGRTLDDRLDEGPPLREVLGLALQAARGLVHAHRSAGLVHRDLKAANILVTPDGIAKVSDFGLALVRGERGERACGTPTHMPPEQWRRPQDVDVRSDVYAFGVLLFQALAGRPLFPVRTIEELEAAHARAQPPDPRTFVPGLPAAAAALVLRCLQKDPAHRPRTFDEVAAALAPLADEPRPVPVPGPGPADEAVNRSRSALSLGEPKEALEFADRALRLAPGHLGGRVARGLALAALGLVPEAVRELRNAAAEHPGSPLPLVNLAHLAHRAGRLDEAQTWLETAAPLARPRELEGCVPILLDAGRLEDAARLIDAILAEDPDSVPTLAHRAVLLRRAGDLEGALGSSDRALELNPRHAKSWSNRATVLVQLGRFGDAIESAQRAIEIEPGLGGAYLAMGAALTAMGRRSEAAACLREGMGRVADPLPLRRALERYGL